MPKKSVRASKIKRNISNIRHVRVLSSEYATFRPYVQEYIMERVLPQYSVLLDPMAGTSPLIPFIETNGYTAYFNDILPVHFYVNKAKQYQIFECYKKYGYGWFLRELLHYMAPLRDKYLCISHKWVDDEALNALVRAWQATEEYDKDITTFFKAIILISMRSFSSFTRTANPTWFKPGGISFKEGLEEIVRKSLTTFAEYYDHFYSSVRVVERGRCIFSSQNAAELKLNQKVDIVLTSPQYCNRLDTMRQYGPELYFLSAVGHTIPDKDVIGTTKVRGYKNFQSDFEYLTSNSEYANRFLNRVKKSPKKDDPTYYLKYYTRYFSMLFRAFKKLSNSLSRGGRMYIILQDNTHRGQEIEIDRVLRQLMRVVGWQSRVKIMGEWHHLGLRNPSKDHAFIKRKQFEKLLVIWR